MKNNKLFNHPFEVWYRPIQILACFLFLFAVTIFSGNDTMREIVGILLVISVLVVLLSVIILILRRQWKNLIYTCLCLVGAFVLFALLAPAIVAD